MQQAELIEGLIRLADLSGFVNEGEEADILAANFHLIENPFDYFMRGLSVSRGLHEAHGTEDCPSETAIVSYILREAASTGSQEWLQHKDECYGCQQRAETFLHLVRNIWKVLNNDKSYSLANIVLAYLRGDSIEQIKRIFNGFGDLHDDTNKETVSLKGILTVEELDENGCVKSCWYGLVRREASFMGSTRCFMCPLGEESPVFLVDIDNYGNRYFFQLFGGIQVEGGLRFYLSPNQEKLVFQPHSLDFAQQMEGVCLLDENMKQERWRAVFWGRVTSPSMDVRKEHEICMENW